MKTIETKVNAAPKQILLKFFDYGLRASVLILFALLFFGRINPARISDSMKKKLSKSAFYFRGLTEDIVALEDSGDSDFDVNPFESMSTSDDFTEDSYEDFYRMLEQMAAEEDDEAEDWEEDDDDSFGFDKAEKIELQKYSSTWSEFADNHPEIASALRYDQFASIFTFFTIIVALAGVFLSFGTNKI